MTTTTGRPLIRALRPTTDDADAWMALLEGVDLHERPVRAITRASYLGDDTSVETWSRRTAGLFVDGVLVGYCRIHRHDDHDEIEGVVHPDHRQAGHGTHLMREAVARVDDGAGPGRVEVSANAENVGHRALLDGIGLRPCRSWLEGQTLFADVPDMPLGEVPADLRLDVYDPGMSEAVRRAHNAACEGYDGEGSVSAMTWAQEHTDPARLRPEVSFVITDGSGEVVAYALNHEVEDAEVPSVSAFYLGVRPDHRGRSLHRVLVGHTVVRSRERGYEAVEYTMDLESPTGVIGMMNRNGLFDPERDDSMTWIVYGGTTDDAQASDLLRDRG